jgi:hypothetical protein
MSDVRHDRTAGALLADPQNPHQFKRTCRLLRKDFLRRKELDHVSFSFILDSDRHPSTAVSYS